MTTPQPAGLADRLTVSTLERALRRAGVPGIDAKRLRTDVVERRYRASPAEHREIRKPDGSARALTIPHPIDRALQAAVLEVITPHLDRGFDDHVHGFRPACSCRGAVDALVSEVGERPWLEVVQIDIEGMFDNLDHGWLERATATSWPDPLWNWLVLTWMRPWAPLRGRGVPQGAPLSPLLSNVYLDNGFDRPWQIVGPELGGVGWIRYADDITLVSDQKGGGELLLHAAAAVLKRCGLHLAPRKVRRMSANEATPELKVLGLQLAIVKSTAGFRLAVQPRAPKARRGTVPPEPRPIPKVEVPSLGFRVLEILSGLWR